MMTDSSLPTAGAALLYIAEKAGKLIPSDLEGRTRVTQWCFAAASTVQLPLSLISMGDAAGMNDKGRELWNTLAKRWFDGLERRLDGREWIACKEFTVADILMATVVREVRKTDLMHAYPRLKDYYARALARPAWECTLESYAKRFGVSVQDIR